MAMFLKDLLSVFNSKALCYSDIESSEVADLALQSVTSDSRRVEQGGGFFAISGNSLDGLSFISNAILNGAVCCFVQDHCLEQVKQTHQASGCKFVALSNVRRGFAIAAQAMAGDPSRDIATIGITGTNGKTSVAWIVSEAIAILKGRAGYLGTLGVREVVKSGSGAASESFSKTDTTTPDASLLAKTLKSLRDKNYHGVAIEVSSHALDQHRVSAINWNCGVITNITRDHLDYHKTFSDYQQAKKLLFTRDLVASNKSPFAVINADDPHLAPWIEELRSTVNYPIYSFSENTDSLADAILLDAELNPGSSKLKVKISEEVIEFNCKLIGRYNALNLLAAVLTLVKLGFEAKSVAVALANVSPVPGRLQPVGNEQRPIFVDYAHTPDAIVSVLKSLREIHQGSITTLFGCGGDRDRGKRPMMAQAALEYSDKVIITSDNPRSEDPQAIINDIIAKQSTSGKFQVVIDRREAIKQAILQQQQNELIVVAGKGHEDYQEIKGVRHHFSDQEVVQEVLAKI